MQGMCMHINLSMYTQVCEHVSIYPSPRVTYTYTYSIQRVYKIRIFFKGHAIRSSVPQCRRQAPQSKTGWIAWPPGRRRRIEQRNASKAFPHVGLQVKNIHTQFSRLRILFTCTVMPYIMPFMSYKGTTCQANNRHQTKIPSNNRKSGSSVYPSFLHCAFNLTSSLIHPSAFLCLSACAVCVRSCCMQATASMLRSD